MRRNFTVKPVLASQESKEIRTYRNAENPNKFIEVKKDNSGHSYARQYMEWDTPEGTVKNYTGAKDPKRGRYSRVRKDTLDSMLEDYDEISSDTDANPVGDDVEQIRSVMYGNYLCACGCGSPLGRPANGVDGKPVEYSYGVGEVSDDEGYNWRMFTEKCWNRVSSDMSDQEIYDSFDPSPLAD